MLKSKLSKLVFLILFLLGIPGLAHAANRYVPGTYSTIQAAINAAVAGDTILINPGVYMEKLTVSKNLTFSRNADSGNVQIAHPNSAYTNPIINITSKTVNLTLNNIMLYFGSSGIRYPYMCWMACTVPFVTLNNVWIINPGPLGGVSGYMNVKANNITVINSQGHGIAVTGNVDLTKVYLQEGATGGLSVRYSSFMSQTLPSGFVKRVLNSNITGNGGDGIYLKQQSFVSISGNTISNNVYNNVEIEGCRGVSLSGNFISYSQEDAEGNYGDGVATIDSMNTTITGGTIKYNARAGVASYGCSRSPFKDNVTLSSLTLQGNSFDLNTEDLSYPGCPSADSSTITDGGNVACPDNEPCQSLSSHLSPPAPPPL